VESLIAEFSLEHIRTNRGDLLSGERRRTEIARCLATDPKFILLDEPRCRSSSRRRYSKNVAQLKDKKNRYSKRIITQETLAITDKTYLMFEGGS
jgi:lipopolysaccharide export system ATP-binding protein